MHVQNVFKQLCTRIHLHVELRVLMTSGAPGSFPTISKPPAPIPTISCNSVKARFKISTIAKTAHAIPKLQDSKQAK